MFISADQLIAHAVGDYVLQSDWMASEKTKKTAACVAHVATYWLPFTWFVYWDHASWRAMAFIVVTHFIIDRWRLARYVCWFKNFLAPRWIVPAGTAEDPATFRYPDGQDPSDPFKGAVPVVYRNRPWAQCSGTGYDGTKPAWLAVWLMIITDNLMHILCNGYALKHL